MDIAEKKRRIDARWDEIRPMHAASIQKQRAALPSLLEDDELPERIAVGIPLGFSFKSVLVVATDRQVLYVTDKDALRLPYPDIESVSVEKSIVKIVGGRCSMGFILHSQPEADRFVAYVKGEDKSPPGEQPLSIEEKTYWINARWDEIRPKHGSFPTKERAMLPSLLADDELPEMIVVGTPKGNSFGNVVVVATDRQVLYVTVKETLRLAYADIESVRIEGGRVEIVGERCELSPTPASGGPFRWKQRMGERYTLSFTPASQKEAELFIAYVNGDDLSPTREPLNPRAVLIDQQWNDLKPASWGNRHSGEREMLHSLVDEGETLEVLVGGTYRAEQDTNRLHRHQGVAVATNKRVLFVDKGMLGSSEVSEMPYRSIEAITYSTGIMAAGIQITGRGIASFRIEDIIDKEAVKPFVDCVRGHLDAAHAPQAAAPHPVAAPLSVADEIEKLASLKERGILTQEEFDAKKRQLLGL